MITAGLSLDQAPPFGVVFRYFVVSLIFGVVVSLFFMLFGSDILSSRYTAEALAVTHLITLGVMGFAMIGTLFQMLPVIAGVVLPTRLAHAIFVLLLLGAVLLPTAFLTHKALFFMLSTTALLVAFVLFAGITIYKLFRVEYPTVTTKLMKFALFALLITALFGAHLAVSRALGKLGETTLIFANLHASWGFVGWAALLILGVAQQVLPMFYVTPRYPKFCRTVTGPLLLGSLVLLIPLAFLDLEIIAKLGIATGIAMLSSMTFARTLRRKRKVADGSLRYWQVAMAMILLSIPFMFVSSDFGQMVMAILFAGGVLALINAMIYKIVPFLAWFHLSASFDPNIPTMHDFIAKKSVYHQLYAFVLAVVCLLIALFVPSVAHIGGLFLLASYLLMIKDFYQTYKLYKKHSGKF